MFAKNTTKFSLKSYSTEIHKNCTEIHKVFLKNLWVLKLRGSCQLCVSPRNIINKKTETAPKPFPF